MVLSVPPCPDVSESIKTIHRSKYPLLTVLVKERDTIYPVAVVKGHDGKERTVQKLLLGLDVYMRIKTEKLLRDITEVARKGSRKGKKNKLSSASVKGKRSFRSSIKNMRSRSVKLSLLHSCQLSQLRMSRISSLSAFDCPLVSTRTRRFSMEEELNWLVVFVESIGFFLEGHRVWTSDLPKKDISTFDLSKTFSDLNWMRREQVTVEEK
uniref:Uncharacterized protein n=1 Tax=Ditylenchus dipsaci TaxID=166011 RepID=A0A915DMS9_9BILA